LAGGLTASNHNRDRRIYAGHDTETEVGRISFVFSQKDASTGKRRNLGTFQTMEKAKQHEREVQYFKKH